MSVDIRKERKTICPREPVQMAIFVDAVLDGEKEKKSLETWAGNGSVNKNDKLDFVDFAFQSDLGQFDGDGGSRPGPTCSRRPTRSSSLRTVFKKQPDKFSFTTQVTSPTTSASRAGGRAGRRAATARAGPPARPGTTGSSGSDQQSGGTGRREARAAPAATAATGSAGRTSSASRRW